MRPINPDNVAPWFDPWKLKGRFMLDGYENYGAPLAKVLGVSKTTVKAKISQSRLSHEDTIRIAQFLKLTPQEYCDMFLKGVFKEETPE